MIIVFRRLAERINRDDLISSIIDFAGMWAVYKLTNMTPIQVAAGYIIITSIICILNEFRSTIWTSNWSLKITLYAAIAFYISWVVFK